MFNKKNLTKKVVALLVGMSMMFVFTGCGENGEATQTDINETNASQAENNMLNVAQTPVENTNTDSKILIAYFSRTGNTQAIANMIANETGGNIFRVETAVPYPQNYNECIDVAKQEQNDNARPELSTHVENMSQYDVIYLGYPNWWGTMPMAMFTFLEEYDFAGKTIVPFCTHGGSRLGRSEQDIALLAPDAKLLEGLSIGDNSIDGAESEVKSWIAGLDF